MRGIAIHPKYALRIGVIYGTDDADMTAFYSHDLRALQELERQLKFNEDILEPFFMEEWNGTEWLELP